MLKRILSIILVLILSLSLFACKKQEEPVIEQVPIAVESKVEEQTPEKTFTDGRLYADGDIISFAETENYYFTVDVQGDNKYISCFTKDGQLLKRDIPVGLPFYKTNTMTGETKKEVTFVPATDIYAVKGDSIVFGCADSEDRYVLVNSDLECKVIGGSNFTDLRYNEAAFLKNEDGYYDILTLGDTDLLYRFNSKNMKTYHNSEFLDYSDLSDIYASYPQAAFKTEDGSYYSFGYVDVTDFILGFKQVPVIVKFSENLQRVAYQKYYYEYNSIFEAKLTGNYIVFAQEVHDMEDDSYINRLIVLDKNLNQVFTKDYVGGTPVEAQAVGENLAVSVYVNGGGTSSYIEILDMYGDEVNKINHVLSYARIYSDNSEGIYLSGKQGDNNVNTVLRRYSKDIELLEETVYETEIDEDKGFGLYFEINNEGKAVALQGNIDNFPLYLKDRTSSPNRFFNFENYFDEPIFAPPDKGDLPVASEDKQLVFWGDYKKHIFADNKCYIISKNENGDYLNAFDSNNTRLWQIRINCYGDSLYYLDGNILTVWENVINAFDAQTGEQQWCMWLDNRVFYVSDTFINEKVHIVVESDEEYGVCTVDGKGNWEYFALPENDYGVPEYAALVKDEQTGEIYCLFDKKNGTTVTKLNDKFEALALYYTENRNVDYFAGNGRVYLSSSVKTNGGFEHTVQVLDNNLNLLNTLQSDGNRRLINTVEGVGFAVSINGVTYLVDIDGNIIKQLAGASDAFMVYKTSSGYVAVVSIGNNAYKVYEYNKDMKLNSLTQCQFGFILDKYPDINF